MSRDVCFPRGRCRRLIDRLTLLVLAFAWPAETPFAQSVIPFRPGLVLTYVMHNLDEPADREFNGFGLGLLNTSSVAYVDMVMSGSITSAGMLSLIPGGNAVPDPVSALSTRTGIPCWGGD